MNISVIRGLFDHRPYVNERVGGEVATLMVAGFIVNI